jgi:ribose-phosphate pyrophosphokinase
MRTALLAMPGNESMAEAIGRRLQADVVAPATRRFPDGETYLRIDADLSGRSVAIVQTLSHPDDKFLPFLFAADAARAGGARRVGFVAPYLAYMRQDRQFQSGEAVTSRTVARLLSGSFDWLVTVDPHLHRYKALSEIYAIPATVVNAATLLSDWIGSHVEKPVLIGPDAESVQWVGDVARRIGAPFTVLEKTRLGDRDIEVRLTGEIDMTGRTPVLVDDIIASGATMLKAVHMAKGLSIHQPVCVAVHGLFADGSDRQIQDAGAQLVTSNTVPHVSNAIDMSGPLADAVAQTAGTIR